MLSYPFCLPCPSIPLRNNVLLSLFGVAPTGPLISVRDRLRTRVHGDPILVAHSHGPWPHLTSPLRPTDVTSLASEQYSDPTLTSLRHPSPYPVSYSFISYTSLPFPVFLCVVSPPARTPPISLSANCASWRKEWRLGRC